MKKQIRKSLLALLLILAMLMGLPLGIGADEEGDVTEEEKDDGPLPMAYNIYSYPQFEGEYAFDTYMIEMRSDLDIDCTYWSLANFHMYISDETEKLYRDISAGGAYAGLQHAGGYKKAIMSFWEWHYWPNGYKSGEEETNLVAECIYPGGGVFGGEGEGSNCIKPYSWKQSQWYRMILHTWEDPVRGTTYCGQWMQDVETGKYTLISYFDTKMIDSYLAGDMMFFMENFYGINAGEERDVKLRNIYYKPHGEDGWVSVDSCRLRHCNNWANNKVGNHSFGATDEYFWGKSGGYVDPEKQEDLDRSQPGKVFTITQPKQPSIGNVQFRELQLRHREDEQFIKWFMVDGSTPQLYYRVKCTDVDGNVIYDKEEWAPEDFYHILEGVNTDAYLCELTVTDLFGQSSTAINATEAYLEVHPDAVLTHPTEKDDKDEGEDESDQPADKGDGSQTQNDTATDSGNTESDLENVQGSNNSLDDDSEGGKTVLVVGIVAGGILLITSVGVGLTVYRKKKKKK